MIDGVEMRPLRVIADDRGRLVEVLRSDDDAFRKFGQVYVTTAYPGVVKAWHCHAKQTDHLAVISGMARIGLYDDRDGSPTRGRTGDVCAGVHNPVLVKVPPGVWHGFRCVSVNECVVMNVPTEVYDRDRPDEIRRPAHDEAIPFDWTRLDR